MNSNQRYFCTKGDLKGALELYKSVLSRPSPPKVALLNTPPVLRALDRHNEAIDPSNHALLAYPFDAGLYNNLGNLYLDIEQDYNAISCYRKDLSIKPDFVEARLSLITFTFKTKPLSTRVCYRNSWIKNI